jgi:transcriptional regulator with XRE-family HTH domain
VRHVTRPGTKIRELRNKKGLTIEQLGQLADIDRSALTNIENGAASLGRVRAERLATALDVDLAVIWSPRQEAASRRDLDGRLQSVEAGQGVFLDVVRAVLAELAAHGIQVRLDPEVAESLATARPATPKR